jgi:hypothetical protein
LVVIPSEPEGALVVVVLAVIAVLKMYTPALVFAATSFPVVWIVEAMTPPFATTAPDTVTLSSSGSAYATPIGLLFAMILSF